MQLTDFKLSLQYIKYYIYVPYPVSLDITELFYQSSMSKCGHVRNTMFGSKEKIGKLPWCKIWPKLQTIKYFHGYSEGNRMSKMGVYFATSLSYINKLLPLLCDGCCCCRFWAWVWGGTRGGCWGIADCGPAAERILWYAPLIRCPDNCGNGIKWPWLSCSTWSPPIIAAIGCLLPCSLNSGRNTTNLSPFCGSVTNVASLFT